MSDPQYEFFRDSSPTDTEEDSVESEESQETEDSQQDKSQPTHQPDTRQEPEYEPKHGLSSIAEYHLKAIDDAYKAENSKLKEELEHAGQMLRLLGPQRDYFREEARRLVEQRSNDLAWYLAYANSIHGKLEESSKTIGLLREKLSDTKIKEEERENIDALLTDLEESQAEANEYIIDVAFELQKDIDESSLGSGFHLSHVAN